MVPDMRVACAWCGEHIEGAPQRHPSGADRTMRTSHGICTSCLGGILKVPLSDVYDLSVQDVDALPFGTIELTTEGTVLTYNAYEEELSGLDRNTVIGADFFRDVAPCTRGTEFQDHFHRLVEAGGGDADFKFLFRFRSGHRLVRIRMMVDPTREGQLIMIRDVGKR